MHYIRGWVTVPGKTWRKVSSIVLVNILLLVTKPKLYIFVDQTFIALLFLLNESFLLIYLFVKWIKIVAREIRDVLILAKLIKECVDGWYP